jgi:hypothetical protein
LEAQIWLSVRFESGQSTVGEAGKQQARTTGDAKTTIISNVPILNMTSQRFLKPLVQFALRECFIDTVRFGSIPIQDIRQDVAIGRNRERTPADDASPFI